MLPAGRPTSSASRSINSVYSIWGETYLRRIDQVIAWAAELGAYTLLDLQWLVDHIAPLPDQQSPRLWRTLADRYHANPAVLYDLYNEPHDVAVADEKRKLTLADLTPEGVIKLSLGKKRGT